MVEEDEAVLSQQIEADSSRYGVRTEPDDVEVKGRLDDRHQMTYLAPLALESPHSPECVISQASPLERWLEQSASVAQGEPAIDRELRERDLSLLQARQEELNEIRAFKNVRVPLTAQKQTQTVALDHVSDDSRIFYRNILDKYPQIPHYLAQRLAEAASRTAQRLISEYDDTYRDTYAKECQGEACIPVDVPRQDSTRCFPQGKSTGEVFTVPDPSQFQFELSPDCSTAHGRLERSEVEETIPSKGVAENRAEGKIRPSQCIVTSLERINMF